LRVPSTTVGEPHPSKQGLKPRDELEKAMLVRVGEPHPSKQGLKPRKEAEKLASQYMVGEPHPSKQGLKRNQVCRMRRSKSESASPIHQNKD